MNLTNGSLKDGAMASTKYADLSDVCRPGTVICTAMYNYKHNKLMLICKQIGYKQSIKMCNMKNSKNSGR